jgi:hypothetical protein
MNGETSTEGHNNDGCRQERKEFLRRQRACVHSEDVAHDDANKDVLADGPAPFSQTKGDISIVAPLTQRSQTQGGECGQNQCEIAQVQNDNVWGILKPEKGLDRVRQNRDAEEENEICSYVQGVRDKVMPEDPVVRQPEPADYCEGHDESGPAGGAKNFRGIRGHIEAGGEERKAETKDKIAESFKTPRETFSKKGRGEARFRGGFNAGNSSIHIAAVSWVNGYPDTKK